MAVGPTFFVPSRQVLHFIGVFDTLSKLAGVTVRDLIYLIALVTTGSWSRHLNPVI